MQMMEKIVVDLVVEEFVGKRTRRLLAKPEAICGSEIDMSHHRHRRSKTPKFRIAIQHPCAKCLHFFPQMLAQGLAPQTSQDRMKNSTLFSNPIRHRDV